MVNFFTCLQARAGVFLTILFFALIPAAAQATPYQLFGMYEEQSSDLSPFAKWTKVLRNAERDNLTQSSVCLNASCPEQQWKQLVDPAKTVPSLEVLKQVNYKVNNYTYIEDSQGWQQSDYWATPREFFEQGGGDCEDYAIVKYMALRAMGWSPDDMRIVVLKDTKINQMHSVLAVHFQGEVYILDNQTKQLVTDRQMSHYVPVYSINERGWWRPTTQKA